MKKTAKTLLILLIGVMSISIAACSDNNDEPQSDGEKALAELNERLDIDGKFRFPHQAPDGQFYGFNAPYLRARETIIIYNTINNNEKRTSYKTAFYTHDSVSRCVSHSLW